MGPFSIYSVDVAPKAIKDRLDDEYVRYVLHNIETDRFDESGTQIGGTLLPFIKEWKWRGTEFDFSADPKREKHIISGKFFQIHPVDGVLTEKRYHYLLNLFDFSMRAHGYSGYFRSAPTAGPLIGREPGRSNVSKTNKKMNCSKTDLLRVRKSFVSLQDKPELELPIDLFNRAHTNPVYSHRLLDGVTALEYLLAGDSSPGVSYKVAVRIARALSHDPTKRKEEFRQAKRLYDLRSRIIHGGVNGKNFTDKDFETEAYCLSTIGTLILYYIDNSFSSLLQFREHLDYER